MEFGLFVWAESPAEKREASDPEPETAHIALVEKVRAKLHGTGKAALLTALNSAGGFTWKGWVAATPNQPGIEMSHFRTPVCAEGIVFIT